MPDTQPTTSAANERFEDVLDGRVPRVAALARQVRALVRSTVPDLNWVPNHGQEGVGFGVDQYGHDGWGVGVLGVAKNWVTLGFMRGAHLPDPRGIVEGTGRSVRHVKIRSAHELEERREALVALLRDATHSSASAGQAAMDLGGSDDDDEPKRHSALAAERSQTQQAIASAQSAASGAQSAVSEAQSVVTDALRAAAKRVASKKPAAKTRR